MVYYEANHTCGDQDWLLCPEVLDDLTKLFEDNSKLSGGNAFRLLFERKLRKIKTNAPSEVRRQQIADLLNVVKACVHDYVPNNIRSAVRKSKCPKGMGIEAVVELQNILKDYYEDIGIILEVAIDTFICARCGHIEYSYVNDEEIDTNCKECKIEMEGRGPMIMLTSKEQIKLAWEMTKKDGVYALATAFLDHQPGRTVHLTTLNCAVYDWNVQEMASLFVAHTKGEDKLSVRFSLEYFDLIIQKYLGDEKYFHPFGFTTDNAGGLICGIKEKFGENIPIRTCKFHFIFSAYQKCGDFIGTRSDKIIFLRFVFSLVDATNASQFYEYCEKFQKWMKEKKSRANGLSNWFDFWHNSRALWSSAFADLNLAKTNLVEGLQSKYSKKNGMKNLPLDQSVIYGISDAMLYQTRLVESSKGKYKGHGPDRVVVESRQMHEELRRVKETAFTYEDLQEIFVILGLPKDGLRDKDNHEEEKDTEETNSAVNTSLLSNKRKMDALMSSPILNENEKRRKVLTENLVSENSPHSFKDKKTPTKANIKPLRKSGRPKGTKRKVHFSRHMDISDVSEESNEDPFEHELDIMESSFTSTTDHIQMFMERDSDRIQNKTKKLKTILKPTPQEQDIFQSGSFNSSIKRNYSNALTKAHRDRNNYLITHIHKQLFKVEKTWPGAEEKRVLGRFVSRPENCYHVDFQKNEVTCSCRDYISILATHQDKICKHIASVLLKCDLKKFVKFHGSRTYRKNSFEQLCEIVSSFSSDQTIVDPGKICIEDLETETEERENIDHLEGVNLNDWSSQDFDELNINQDLHIEEENPSNFPIRHVPIHARGPYSHIHKALAAVPVNDWYVEVYGNTGSPRCRSILCKKKIQRRTGCIRSDVFGTYTDRNTNKKYLCIDTMRFCLNDLCHRNADASKLKFKKFERMSQLSIQFISSENQEIVRKYFGNCDLNIID